MTHEQEKELRTALEKLEGTAEYKELTKLVQSMRGAIINDPSLERAIDEILIVRGAWIYDTINDSEKMTKKVRKVLGYTFP